MVGQRNSLLQKTRSAQGCQKSFDVGCPFHLAHLCVEKGVKELSENVEILLLTYIITFTGVQN